MEELLILLGSSKQSRLSGIWTCDLQALKHSDLTIDTSPKIFMHIDNTKWVYHYSGFPVEQDIIQTLKPE